MSLVGSAKQEAARIAEDISKNQNEIMSQLRQFDDMKNAIEAIMGGTATGADKKVIGLIADASQKSKTAQGKLREASARMKEWAAEV